MDETSRCISEADKRFLSLFLITEDDFMRNFTKEITNHFAFALIQR
jgi:hypothetical protein